MTRYEILCMVRDAREQTMKELPPNTFDLDLFHERFFKLAYAAGATAEREACAKVCDISDLIFDWEIPGGAEGRQLCNDIAAAIRARGNK